MDCEKIKKYLENLYGEKVICGFAETKYQIQYAPTRTKLSQAEMAIYIHTQYKTAIVWNVRRRRKEGRMVKSFSLPGGWEKTVLTSGEMQARYKKMGTDWGAPYEKVLVLHVDVLQAIADELYNYLGSNKYDTEFPYECELEHEDDFSRERVSTSRWERDRRFRNEVLKAYGNRCAICRCGEEKLLEAAHIVAVADGGNDESKNGICLCANHHIMFDKGLIKIDFENKNIMDIADSVRAMAWYTEFIEMHGGRILCRNDGEEVLR
ncbi:HNH endonuclease [Lachnospiraceae bacterium XBB1006]|nr:HNH endonuclease [Lachnospiraceae bacterium XBB1006]